MGRQSLLPLRVTAHGRASSSPAAPKPPSDLCFVHKSHFHKPKFRTPAQAETLPLPRRPAPIILSETVGSRCTWGKGRQSLRRTTWKDSLRKDTAAVLPLLVHGVDKAGKAPQQARERGFDEGRPEDRLQEATRRPRSFPPSLLESAHAQSKVGSPEFSVQDNL